MDRRAHLIEGLALAVLATGGWVGYRAADGTQPANAATTRVDGGGASALARSHSGGLPDLTEAGCGIDPLVRPVSPGDDPCPVTARQTTPGPSGPQPIQVEYPSSRAADVTIDLRTAAVGDTWMGVGAALTDASVTVLTGNDQAIDLLFDPALTDGAALDVVRLPLSATDFSMREWTWSWNPDSKSATPPGEAVQAAQLVADLAVDNPELTVVGAAWTSPPEMRTRPQHAGGALLDPAGDDYAALLVAQAGWLLDRGVPLRAVSLGNEPGHVGDYPTLSMTADQMVALSRVVEPRLDRLGVDLWALDHNWADSGLANRLIDDGSFDAVAFHCYEGSPAEMSTVDAARLVSECTATTGDWMSSVAWMSRELIGTPIHAGSRGLLMWNLALDSTHGPKVPGGCEDCRGLLTVDPPTGHVERSPEFDVLVHLSSVADPGASVLAAPQIDRLPLALFHNPDGSYGVFGHNDSASPITIDVERVGATTVRISVDAWSVFSVTW